MLRRMYENRIGITWAQRLARKTVAIAVDDDASFRECLRMMLRVGGFDETIGASDADEALAIAQSRKVDLIVSDWNMAPRDGLDLLRDLRQQQATRLTPFILVTASLSEDAWRGAIELGATDFLVKPFSIEQLHGSADLCLALTERRTALSNVINFDRRRRRWGG
jgi:two-component system, chemotaxis family, chemotaxis protein CheY